MQVNGQPLFDSSNGESFESDKNSSRYPSRYGEGIESNFGIRGLNSLDLNNLSLTIAKHPMTSVVLILFRSRVLCHISIILVKYIRQFYPYLTSLNLYLQI